MNQGERNSTICQLVKDGATMTSVGEEFGMSRERVRQIVYLYTGLTGHGIQASIKAKALKKRRESDLIKTVTLAIANNWTCTVCGGWNLRKAYEAVNGNSRMYERCSNECTILNDKLRFRFERDSFNAYQARSILSRGSTNKYAVSHATNVLNGTNVEHPERFYTRAGSKNDKAIKRVMALRKALRTEHLFDDFPRVLTIS